MYLFNALVILLTDLLASWLSAVKHIFWLNVRKNVILLTNNIWSQKHLIVELQELLWDFDEVNCYCDLCGQCGLSVQSCNVIAPDFWLQLKLLQVTTWIDCF